MRIKGRLKRLEKLAATPSGVLHERKIAEVFRSVISTDIGINEALNRIAELNKNRP